MPETLSRRERYRAETLDEIKRHAAGQLASGGPAALSLNAIAKAMGVSGPALYRYFKSRDELVTALIVDGYADLATALERAAEQAARRAPAQRVHAVAAAYRAWAHAEPQRYTLQFTAHPAGYAEPGEVGVAAHRAMAVFLAALGALDPDAPAAPARSKLDRQLVRWAAERPGTPDVSVRVLELGVVAWTRLHGFVSLELLGPIAAMGLDADALFAREVDRLVEAAAG